MPEVKPRICVDFDDTIFDGDGLKEGCIEALTQLRERFTIAIFSARLTDSERAAMVNFLTANSVPYDEVLERKPEAVAYIDDKAVRFTSWDKIVEDLKCVS